MISEKYKDLYISTSKDQLKKLTNFLLSLERSPENQNLIENIFRLIHSMKGAAATMGYKKTVLLFHAMESVIDAAFQQRIFMDKRKLDLFFGTIEILNDNLKSIKGSNREINLSKQIDFVKASLRQGTRAKNIVTKNVYHPEKHILGSIPTVAEISVPVENLSTLHNLSDDLLLDVMSIKSVVKSLGDVRLLSLAVDADKIINDIRRELEKIRIVPLSQVFSSLPYLVREIARDEGKEVELLIEDNDLSLDKSILDELIEILIQLLKNAVAHGVYQGQKNAKIEVFVAVDNDQMNVAVKDNGRGIDWQQIMNMAVKNKIISRAVAKKLTVSDIKNLIFKAGISRGKSVSISSGRGVGLSLVKSKVEDLGGEILVESQAGKGAEFKVRFPLPLSVFRALTFKIADYTLAIPLNYIDNIIKLPEVIDFSKAKFFVNNKIRYELTQLPKEMCLPKLAALSKYIAIIKYKNKKLALPIFSNINERELIAKNTPQVIRKLNYIKGIAISDEGLPVLILNINNFVK
ncbi:hypothetical protein C4566_00250 [Candidatus Parcubacteria bacterium]|nr:MAG: hypothetical protein C4566_00250 [Candidatus Parcubacteria bacterium]